jgi:hypothetical protein
MNDMNEDPALQYLQDPDTVPPAVPLEQCFVFFDGKLRVNANGRKRFGDRFRRAGFDIEKIRTFDELEAALKGSWHIVLGDMERAFEMRAAGKNTLEHRAVRACYRGDYDLAKTLMEKSKRVRRLGLKVIPGREEPP